MNSKNAGRKPKLQAKKGDRKDQQKRADDFKNAQSGLKDIQQNPPRYLDATAKRMWRFLVSELTKGDLIKQLDATELELFCKQYSIYREAVKDVDEHSVVFPIYKWYDTGGGKMKRELSGMGKNPAVSVVDSMSRQLKSLANDLGLNFNARSSMKMASNDADNKDKDAQEALMKMFGGGAK